MSREEELQRNVTRLALKALGGTSFALAGSGAIREHGIIDRPTEDVDLFTSNVNIGDFGAAIDQVLDALRASGYGVEAGRRSDQFARLQVRAPNGQQVDIDMGMDWREAEPVILSIGPVLSLADAVGNKVSALYSRAEARDFLDVDAIRASGTFNDTQLIEAATERDAGFEVPMFIQQLDRAQRLTPDRVEEYDVDTAQLDAIKARFATWSAELVG